jgi:hypothetical protein
MRDLWEQTPDSLKLAFDMLSITTLLGTLTQMLPHVAAILTIIWTALRIFETQTVQNLLGKKGAGE